MNGSSGWMRPTVGGIVHYVSHGTPPRADGSQAYTSECRAAIVTRIGDMPPGSEHIDPQTPVMPDVGLCVLNPTGLFFHENVPCSHPANRHGGTWHWPEREDG